MYGACTGDPRHGHLVDDSSVAPAAEEFQGRKDIRWQKTLSALCISLIALGCYQYSVTRVEQDGRTDTLEASNQPGILQAIETIPEYLSYAASSGVDPTHIVFVLADDQGFNDVGYSSNDLEGLTPTLDSLAGQGIKLMQYYGQQLCTPARGALMTGKYPIHIGLHHDVIHPDAPWGLPLKEKVLPEYLKTLGYKTHMVGKWHLGHFSLEYMPAARGFDTFFGYLTDTVKYYTHTYPDSFQGKEYFDMVRQDSTMKDFPLNFSVVDDMAGKYTATLFNEQAAEILKQHNPTEPLFLYMSYQNTHEPYTPAPHDSWMSEHELALIANVSGSNRRAFAKSLIMLDHGVDNLTQTLDMYGLMKNTLLIYSSDNGGCPQFGGYNYPLRGMKYYLFEGGVRVHGFVHGSMIPLKVRGESYEGMMHISDWVPTILSALNVSELPEDLDGIDQWKALTTLKDYPAYSPRKELLYNIDPYYSEVVSLPDGSMTTMLQRGKPRAAIRVGDWKLLLNEYCVSYFNPLENLERPEGCGQDSCATPGNNVNSTNFLFNLIDDPYEETNVIDDYPAIAMKLMDRIDEFMDGIDDTHFRGTDAIAYAVWAQTGFITPWVMSDPVAMELGDSISPYEEV